MIPWWAFLIGLIGRGILSILVASAASKRQGRNAWGWFFLCLFTSPILAAIVLRIVRTKPPTLIAN